jgi:hypothetical protein
MSFSVKECGGTYSNILTPIVVLKKFVVGGGACNVDCDTEA